MKEIFERIEATRKEKGVKQKQITEACGMNETNYTQWRQGITESYIKYLPKIAGVLNCSVDYLATGKENEAEDLWRAFCAAPERVRVGIRVILGID